MFFKLVHYLEGKKTYLIGFALGAFNLALQQGIITLSPKSTMEINFILSAFGLAALRAGVAKNNQGVN